MTSRVGTAGRRSSLGPLAAATERVSGALPGAALAALAAAAAVLWSGSITPSSDGRYALAWGADLARRELPNLTAPSVPTPHPLPLALGAALAPLGPAGAARAWALLAGLAFAGLLFSVFRLGATLGGAGAGVLAAAIVASRPRTEFFSLHGFVDVPYAALVLGAAGVAGAAPRRRWRGALALLAAAGLLRPEAWPLAAAYAGWLVLGGGSAGRLAGRSAVEAVALALSAPLGWAAFDLFLTGDALHSLHATQAGAVALGRATGLERLPDRLAVGVGRLAGWPVVAGAVLALLANARRGARASRPAPARGAVAATVGLVLAGLGAFAATALAGLPLNDRYLLVPAAGLAVLAAGGAAQALRWPTLVGAGRTARSPALLAALVVTVAGTLATLPDDLRVARRTAAVARDERAAQGALERLLARAAVHAGIARCPRLSVDGRVRAAVAATLRRDPAAVSIARTGPPLPGRSLITTADAVPAVTPATVRKGGWTFVDGCWSSGGGRPRG